MNISSLSDAIGSFMQNALLAANLNILSFTSKPNTLACGSEILGHIVAEANRASHVSFEALPKY